MAHRHSKRKRYEKFKAFEERMSERDSARSIVRSLSIHDTETGEIVFSEENLNDIRLALIVGKYCVEKPCFNAKPERVWLDIDAAAAEEVMSCLDDGEVLNRPAEPCWWRG